ncbi:MAG: hypothetical protein CGU28_14165 [Candidatus Dactylopiibacterium carminicum]|uniref:DUF1178 domain-containing protein n=1 Tax=Candidatus Dactylopiibacterium carminicum TaxID=857335 RepID=A0A272EZZ8_9RHOO|nr:DUF1178 domain-containing protein [Candidatus Dactylopiibacterium carminicum]PAS94206.1 MAG: hypothetical protein CGU28_14165 [Candidatus Dactylopiibacterium carminicum]PAS95200.1 MAG: hypothetical protein CGU29_01790 [Candidatus Dactylopiibacterium carminicum]PAT00568.1 MAG: hypothetical protein BSR46_01395 [Candidatus Dactylopiibacterium carminicum]
MIVLDLECPQGHRFEGWFASPEAFAEQNAAGQISCPVCSVHPVRRLPSAAHVGRGSGSEVSPPAHGDPEPAQLLGQLLETLRNVAAHSEDVGDGFVAEVRRIQAGEAEQRPVRGIATAHEAITLLEEGINVLPLPPAKEDLH